MNYLITAAGKGSRFIKSGIKPPKPLIKVNNKELLIYSLESFDIKPSDNLFITCLKKDNVKKILSEKLQKLYPNVNIFWHEIESITRGQLITSLKTINFFDIKGELIIHNCDTAYKPIEFKKICLDEEFIFGVIPFFISEGDQWSFILEEKGNVKEVREKQRISDKCSVGTYYFKSSTKFIEIADEYLNDYRNKGLDEIYISPLYSYALEKGYLVKSIKCYEVRNFGTCQELLKTFKKSFFDLLSENDFTGHQRKTLVVDIDDTICTKLKSENYIDAKPVLAICNKLIEESSKGTYIILFTARNMRTFRGNLGLINKFTANDLLKWLERYKIPFDELYYGKPWGSGELYYLDDKSLSLEEFKDNNFRIY
tara:strand:- start:302 stop:1408 length:1107 start_codon:yes stop_codon:yes gene_type:complete